MQSYDVGLNSNVSCAGECTPHTPTTFSSVCNSVRTPTDGKLTSFREKSERGFRHRSAVVNMGSDANPAQAAEGSEDEVGRPLVSKEDVVKYMNASDLADFLRQHNLTAVQYSEGVVFPIGEGGREFLRAALLHYTDGRTLQGASVPTLLKHAHSLGLWPLVQRIRAERSTGTLTGMHLAFSNFKAAQSRRRRRSSTAAMHAIRDANGKILSIIYDPNKTLPVGLQGRNRLKFLITKRVEEDPSKARALLVEHGLDGVRLRDASVAELLALAWVLGLWQSVEEIAQANEDHKRSILAQRVASGQRNIRCLRDQSSNQSKRPCTLRQQSADSQEVGVGPRSAIKDVSGDSTSDPDALVERQHQVSDHTTPSRGYMDSPYVSMKLASTPACHAGRQDTLVADHSKATAEQSDATKHHSMEESPSESLGNVCSPESSHSGDPCGHLERIRQLVSAANPAAPNAKAVAAEVVKELLALVKKRLLPDPPAEVLMQLQSAAVRLGVHVTPIHSPKVNTSPEGRG